MRRPEECRSSKNAVIAVAPEIREDAEDELDEAELAVTAQKIGSEGVAKGVAGKADEGLESLIGGQVEVARSGDAEKPVACRSL